MRLTIFWRIILAQSALIALVLVVGLYALGSLNRITCLDTGILTVDSACVGEEKRLLKIFLAEMRNAEKYLVSRDRAFLTAFIQGGGDFSDVLSRVTALIDTSREKELLTEIGALHSKYIQGLNASVSGKGGWDKVRGEAGDGIIDRTNELIRAREQAIADKTSEARDVAAGAARMMGWLIPCGIAGALLLAYFHAHGVSRPLKRLARGDASCRQWRLRSLSGFPCFEGGLRTIAVLQPHGGRTRTTRPPESRFHGPRLS